MFELETAAVLALLATIVVMIVLYRKVLPRSKDGTFNGKFGQFLHDYFHFKKLYVEEVLKFIFTLATVACVCFGVFVMLGYEEHYSYSYYSGSTMRKESTFLYGLLITVAGPIALRLVYELAMMGIMLVKNVIDINNKLPNKKTVSATPVAPVAPAAPETPAVPEAPVAETDTKPETEA